MNGAQALLRTMAGSGVNVCFANPGTSEMHFVAALDNVPDVRGVLCLFEGVATGAADGYGRMTGKPAAALLHLAPGLTNGLANLLNARRASTPLVAVVGDHASSHERFDAPLASDIDALARTVSCWVRRQSREADVGADAAAAIAAAKTPPGQVATLILPADAAWSEGGEPAPPAAVRLPSPAAVETIGSAAAALRSGEPCVILLGGTALRRPGLEAASRLAVAGARSPVSFFAYPGRPSSPVPPGCEVHVLADGTDDVAGALAALADLAAPDAKPAAQRPAQQAIPDGRLTAETVAAVIGALLPEGAVVCDEANT